MDKHSKQAIDRAMYVAKVLGYPNLRAILSLCLKGTRAEALETIRMLDKVDQTALADPEKSMFPVRSPMSLAAGHYMKRALEDAESLLLYTEKRLSDKRIAKLQPGEKIVLSDVLAKELAEPPAAS